MKKLASMLISAMMVFSMAGCSSKPTEPEVPAKTYGRNESADVVIVGAGGAGLAAALEAVDNGAESVIVIEQLPMTGGELNATGGTISAAETKIQELDGLTEDTLESYKKDIMHEGSKLGGVPNEALLDIYVAEARDATDWLWDNGLKDYKYSEDKEGHKSVFAPEHALYSYPRTYKPQAQDPTKYKAAVHELMDKMIANEPKIKVELNTQVTALLGNESGQVLMAEASTTSGETVLYTATKGLIMATGGYSANPALMSAYNSDQHGVITGGLPSATGMGIKLMQEVGGAIDERSMTWVPTFPMGLENPDAPGTGRIMTTKSQFAGGILVNQDGKRYVNETSADNAERELALEIQPEGINWEVYTDEIKTDLEASTQGGMMKFFFNSEAGDAYIVKATSLDELAEKTGMPADALKATVESYNQHVDDQSDDEFGRKFVPEEGNSFNVAVNKIEGDNYYAVRIKPLCVITMGGMSVNTNMQVLDQTGNAIPGLYAAGEVVGGIWGRYISSGVGVMGSIAFGRLAARALMTTDLASGEAVKPATNMLDAALFEVKKVETKERFDMSKALTNGEYTAEVDGQEGKMNVKVVITDGKIASVELVSHKETESIAKEALDKMPVNIVEKNSVNIDTISGATLTSERILNAVTDCLTQASK